jgi:pimeloyl-ACP methyl ester carboxylesterase
MVKSKPKYGIFENGIPYARYGEGKKSMLVFFGGPGNELPKGLIFNFFKKGLEPFVEDYTLYIVSRKSALNENYTTKDMADDYAEMIKNEFEGKVDVIIGTSYGGLIAQHLATDYPELFNYIVIAMAAHQISEEGKELDQKFAELLSNGRYKSAYALISNAIYPRGFKRRIYKALFWIVGAFVRKPSSETFSKDVLIEAKAEVEHNATEILPRIKVPVLIICGDKDFYFPVEYVKEMANLIPKSSLKLYPNKGHEIFEDKRFAKDVRDFIERN